MLVRIGFGRKLVTAGRGSANISRSRYLTGIEYLEVREYSLNLFIGLEQPIQLNADPSGRRDRGLIEVEMSYHGKKNKMKHHYSDGKVQYSSRRNDAHGSVMTIPSLTSHKLQST
jgi:hypothetical protein